MTSRPANIDVLITEVGLRDGLQSIAQTMPTASKFAWIDALVTAGLHEIEVTSFVPDKLMPQLADAAQVVKYAVSLPNVSIISLVPNLRGAQAAIAAGTHKITIPTSASAAHSLANVRKTREAMIAELRNMVAYAVTKPNVSIISLVPNLRGAQAAIAAGTHKITIPTSASAAHSLANVRKTREAMIAELRNIVAYRNELAPQVGIEAGVSVAFGCTLQGVVPDDDVIWMVEQCKAAGADTVGLADTTGMANPAQVRRVFQKAIVAVGLHNIAAAHMHNTRGLGIANCLAAYDVGIRGFDSSMAGLGGCPHAPGASGNVVTEDLVFMFEAMGVKTGIDLEKLIAARTPMMAGLPGEAVYGMVAQAGLTKGFTYAK